MMINTKILAKTFLFTGVFLIAFFVFVRAASAASLSLSPKSGNVKSGQDLSVQVFFDSKADDVIDGVDAVLTFDADQLKPKDVKTSNTFKNLITKESKGKLQISALASTKGDSFSPNTSIASVTFTVLQSGVASVGFDFGDNSTVDSNVVQHGTLKDILESVNGGNYSVQATPTNQAVSFLKRIFPFLILIFILILLGLGAFWFFRRGGFSMFGSGGNEDVFYPESVPLDQVPTDTASSPQPVEVAPPNPEAAPTVPQQPDQATPAAPSADSSAPTSGKIEDYPTPYNEGS